MTLLTVKIRPWLCFILRAGLALSCFALVSCSHSHSAEFKPAEARLPPSATAAVSVSPSSAQSSSLLEERKSQQTTQPSTQPQTAEQNTTFDDELVKRAEKIALLLPTTGQLSSAARVVIEGFMAARDQDKQRANITAEVQVYNTDAEPIVGLYQTAIAQGATIVVGPIEKEKVAELKAARNFPVPVLALNYFTEPAPAAATNPAQAATPRDKGYFFQFGLAVEDEAEQIADQAVLEGYQAAAVLYPDSEWGKRVAQSFMQRWRKQGGTIAANLLFSDPAKVAPDLKRLLAPKPGSADAKAKLRRRQDIDFIFLLATPDQARQIKPILNFYYAGDIPVYATSSIYTGTSDPTRDRDLNGIFFVDQPWLLEDDDAMKSFAQSHWPNQSGQTARLRGLGIDAYRLQDQLTLFASSAHTRVQGVTGQLNSDKARKIHRHLSWARIHNGMAELMQSASDTPEPLTEQNTQ